MGESNETKGNEPKKETFMDVFKRVKAENPDNEFLDNVLDTVLEYFLGEKKEIIDEHRDELKKLEAEVNEDQKEEKPKETAKNTEEKSKKKEWSKGEMEKEVGRAYDFKEISYMPSGVVGAGKMPIPRPNYTPTAVAIKKHIVEKYGGKGEGALGNVYAFKDDNGREYYAVVQKHEYTFGKNGERLYAKDIGDIIGITVLTPSKSFRKDEEVPNS